MSKRTPELMTAQICAKFLSISVPTLLRWTRSGEGPPRLKVSKRYRYSKEALKEWLRTGGASLLLPRADTSKKPTTGLKAAVGSPHRESRWG